MSNPFALVVEMKKSQFSMKLGKLPYSYTGVWRELERAVRWRTIRVAHHLLLHGNRSPDSVGPCARQPNRCQDLLARPAKGDPGGHYPYSFGVFSVFYFGDRLHWNHFLAFDCLIAGAFFMFHKF